MCLIFLSINQHPTYSLIVAANRDEFYERKTAPADFWNDHPNILGGRDLGAGGTWMGITQSGKISMITNYRDLKNLKSKAPSRGQLVSDYLIEEVNPENYLKGIESSKDQYNGFNLIVGSANELWYLSNYKSGIEKITSGVHGLSNALLDTPWPKVLKGKSKFEQIIKKDKVEADDLFTMLLDEQVAPDAQLPDTGVGLERERQLSSMFIKSPGYGSRCSTVVLIDKNDHVLFAERVYDLKTFQYTVKKFEFNIQSTNEE
ncbi:MAG TPA: NRDE family protein [Cyclobacteriaceae bacterium]